MARAGGLMERRTSQRAAIRQAFVDENRPLGVEDVLRAGQRMVPSLNQATVYRNLKLLAEEGWLSRIHHPVLGTLYERTRLAHHHHFLCRVCRRVFELPGCALSETAVPPGFVMDNHEVFLSGSCYSCAR